MEVLKRGIEKRIEEAKKIGKLTKFRELVAMSMYNFTLEVKDRLKIISNRIEETFEEEEGDYYISTLLIPKEELAIYEDEFQPILKWKKEEYSYIDIDNNYNLIIDRFPIILPSTLSLSIEQHPIIASYIKDGKRYRLDLKLVKNEEYLKKAKELYNLFRKNKKKWNSFPMFYLNNIYDLVIVGGEFEGLKRASSYDELEYDFGSLTPFVYEGYIPVWNVFSEATEPAIMVRPLKSRLIYEYIFPNRVDDNVLIDSKNGELAFVYRGKDNSIKAHVNNNKGSDWRVVSLKQTINFERYKKEKFPVLTNETLFLSDKQKRLLNDNRLQELEELKKFLVRHKSLSSIRLQEAREVEGFDLLTIYPSNSFVNNEFRLKEMRKKILVSFGVGRDSMASGRVEFAVSLIAKHFPEYEVGGKIVSD